MACRAIGCLNTVEHAFFLDDSLTEQSCKVVKARLIPLELACDQYDVDTFRSTIIFQLFSGSRASTRKC